MRGVEADAFDDGTVMAKSLQGAHVEAKVFHLHITKHLQTLAFRNEKHYNKCHHLTSHRALALDSPSSSFVSRKVEDSNVLPRGLSSRQSRRTRVRSIRIRISATLLHINLRDAHWYAQLETWMLAADALELLD